MRGWAARGFCAVRQNMAAIGGYLHPMTFAATYREERLIARRSRARTARILGRIIGFCLTACLVVALRTEPQLRAMVEGMALSVIGSSQQAEETTDPQADAIKGDLPLPVQGQLLREFNVADAAGITRPGVILAARPRAMVTSPVTATILFRGPLLDYGNVVILEPAADVLFVIAGLAEVYGEAGQVIPTGSPIGLLGGEQPAVDEILNQTNANPTTITGAGQSETLYLEVREGQSPVNPATWFALE